jgi:predicted DNA binding CopG/RHH family protein
MKKKLKNTKSYLPKFNNDKEIEEFINKDLSQFLNKDNFHPTTFEIAPKNKTVTIRFSEELLKSVKFLAKEKGIDYQKLIRQAVEDFIKKAS